MSVFAYAAVWSESRAEGLALLVLLALADSANKETGETRLGVGSLAEMTKIAPSTTRTKLRELEALEEIVVVDPGGGRGNSPTWRINLGRYRNSPSAGGFLEEEKAADARRVSEPEAAGNAPESRRKAADAPARFDGLSDSLYREPRSAPDRNEREDLSHSSEERLARRWCEIRNVPATRPVVRAFVGEIRDFLNATGAVPSEAWLRTAADAGIRRPAGWGSFAVDHPVRRPPDPDQLAETERRVAEARERVENEPIGEPSPEAKAAIDRLVGGLGRRFGSESTDDELR